MRSSRIVRHCAGLAVFIAATVAARPSAAVNLRATPSFAMTAGWDSNILSTSRGEISDFMINGRPSLILSSDVADSTINLSGGFVVDRYLRHSELDTFSGMVNYGLNVTRPLQLTARLSVQPDARYVKTNNTYRRNEVVLQSVSDVLSSGAVTESRTDFEEYGGGLRANYRLGETLTLNTTLSGLRQKYTSATGPSGVKIWHGNVALNSETSRQSYWGVFFDANEYDFDTNEVSNVYTGGLQKSARITESYTLSGRGGASYWRNWRPAVGTGEPDLRRAWSPYLHIALARDRQDFHGTIGGGYEITGTGGFSTATRTINGFVLASDQFASRWRWDLYLEYRKARAVQAADRVNVENWEARLAVRHRLSENSGVSLSVNHMRQYSSGLTGTDVIRTVALIGLDYAPMFVIF